jgi:hypothetical protein
MSLSLPFALATSVTPPTPDAEIRADDDALAPAPALVETRRNIHRHPELGNTLVWDCLARTR